MTKDQNKVFSEFPHLKTIMRPGYLCRNVYRRHPLKILDINQTQDTEIRIAPLPKVQSLEICTLQVMGLHGGCANLALVRRKYT